LLFVAATPVPEIDTAKEGSVINEWRSERKSAERALASRSSLKRSAHLVLSQNHHNIWTTILFDGVL
jgi:hypothetical protein